MTSELSKSVKSLRDVIDDLNLHVVHGGVTVHENGLPIAHLDFEQSILLLRVATPRVTYVYEDVFDAVDDTLAVLADVEVTDLFAPFSKEIDAVRKAYSKFNGQVAALMLSFMVDGILHLSVESEDWKDAFDEAISDITERFEVAKAAVRNEESESDKQEIHEKAGKLADHPSFTASKSSFEKRAFLAETLFPNLGSYQIQQITERADNIVWLKNTGFELP